MNIHNEIFTILFNPLLLSYLSLARSIKNNRMFIAIEIDSKGTFPNHSLIFLPIHFHKEQSSKLYSNENL